MLLIEQSLLITEYPDIWMFIIVYLTLQMTVVSAKRSFSEIEILNNYIHSTMVEERLSSLLIISIENKCTRQLNFEKLIDKFAQIITRKVQIYVYIIPKMLLFSINF